MDIWHFEILVKTSITSCRKDRDEDFILPTNWLDIEFLNRSRVPPHRNIADRFSLATPSVPRGVPPHKGKLRTIRSIDARESRHHESRPLDFSTYHRGVFLQTPTRREGANGYSGVNALACSHRSV